jgi:murein DD-endopeptidase MepM/ murein hydrolase activator NlpD
MLGRIRPASRRGIVVLAAATAASILLLSSPALGGSRDDKNRVDKEMARAAAALEGATAKAQAAGVEYIRASQQLPGAQLAVQQARGRVAAAQVKANEAARVAATSKAELAAAEATLAATERKVEAARHDLDEFIRSSYEGSHLLGPKALLGARTPDEVIDSLNYLDSLAGTQKRVVDAMSKARFEASQHRAEVDKRKRAADVADARARGMVSQARGAQSEAESAQSQVVQLVSLRKKALRIAQQEKTANAKQYAALQAESRQISAALRAAATFANGSGGSQPRGDGTLSKPVTGWKSSDFGMRYDPYYNVWQLHAGTDFAAPAGAPIWAAADGVVVRAGWNGGYGNYTCIYHYELPSGRSLSTCYAHQSRIGVFVGQHVKRGDLIGRVGTTGASTGNHLHFEVRLDGEPVNPLPWL